MRVVVVGCGRIGSTLAYQLSKKGYLVTIIDQDISAFDSLPEDFQGRTVEGDVLSANVLHRAELEGADALVAVTSSDTLNAIIAHIAKTQYRVSRVIAKNYEPRLLPLQQAFGIPVVGSAIWGAQNIEALLSDEPLHVKYIDREAGFAVYQLEVPQSWHLRPWHELFHDDRLKLLSMTRAGQPEPFLASQPLQAGDLIYFSADVEEIEALRHRLGLQ